MIGDFNIGDFACKLPITKIKLCRIKALDLYGMYIQEEQEELEGLVKLSPFSQKKTQLMLEGIYMYIVSFCMWPLHSMQYS